MIALIAMSGGVDSSVAAKLMKDEGFDCTGCTMKLFENEDAGLVKSKTCCSVDDAFDAELVARKLGMPFYVFNYTDDFRREVIGRFACAYLAGRTPNPCIDCNRFLKFGALMKRASVLGFDFVVTGHYARVEAGADGRFRLLKGLDASKDQSYVLYNLTQKQLERLKLPLGVLTKDRVRAIAAENGFFNAKKPDSQDICFAPDGDYAAAVERFTKISSRPGLFVDEEGRTLGEHKGILHYTVGQRKGLGIAFGEPMFVLHIDAERNEVVLGKNEALFSRSAELSEVNWISGSVPAEPVRCRVRIRYKAREAAATVTPLADGCAQVLFDEPQRAITPGQSAVFYSGDEVLGGGLIDREKLTRTRGI